MANEFYSHGKLLITGEYLVLEGALAFAVPTKFGQKFNVEYLDQEENQLVWETYLRNTLVFRTSFSKNNFEILSSSDFTKASYIQKLLQYANENSDVIKNNDKSIRVISELEFPLEWGLGSSSSLISNLSYWTETNPYSMLFHTSKGSGYDIACARASGPILYQKKEIPHVVEHVFTPDFLESIYFVYLGKKQNSLASIEHNWGKIKDRKKEVEQISAITMLMLNSKTIDEFNGYIVEHEQIISTLLGMPTVKSELFPDFEGEVKSLGAWGGDFVMATSKKSTNYIYEYFGKKGMNTIFTYKDMVL
jgi:mevalonate kinase